MLDEFWKRRFAKAWFSRSILSFSLRRTEMFRDRGPTLAAFLFFNYLFVEGPCTDDHFPWLMSTSLLSKMAFSLFKSMFFSTVGQRGRELRDWLEALAAEGKQ